MPVYWISFQWSHDNRPSPYGSNVMDKICTEAGYPEAAEEGNIGWYVRVLETNDSAETIAGKLKNVIGSGYPFKRDQDEGIITGVEVKPSPLA